jgi:hypothetical protein
MADINRPQEMSAWSVVGGPHQYSESPYGDIDAG